jgi:hypothetical protein
VELRSTKTPKNRGEPIFDILTNKFRISQNSVFRETVIIAKQNKTKQDEMVQFNKLVKIDKQL